MVPKHPTDQDLSKATGLYPEAVRRYRIAATVVHSTKGSEDYEWRLREFCEKVAKTLDKPVDQVTLECQILYTHPMMEKVY